MKKLPNHLIGLFHALGVVIYCLLLSGFFLLIENASVDPPGFLGFALMLVILVFSAAVTSSLVFGYPVYLAFHGKVKKALTVLTYTFLYFLIIIAIILFVVAL